MGNAGRAAGKVPGGYPGPRNPVPTGDTRPA